MKQTLYSLAIAALLLLTGHAADAQYIWHIAGNNDPGHVGDGWPSRSAALRCPTSVIRDSVGNIYIADGGPFNYDNDGRVRKINAVTGIIATIAGMYHAPDSAAYKLDSIPATNARLNGCSSICFDTKGKLLIADGYSCIRKVDLQTGLITTIAGSKTTPGFAGDFGPATAARLNGPVDICVDGANNIYVADMNNQVIRKISGLTGIITTVAGHPGSMGYGGDNGQASAARLNQPHGIYADFVGNLYIADYNNNRVRKVNVTTGIITTIAGNGPGFSGDGGPATAASLAQPARVTLDASGNVFIADVANQRIRKISGSGNISTYAGDGETFFGADSVIDGDTAVKSSFVPYGMCFDLCGNMYIGSVVWRVYAITPSIVFTDDSTLCGVRVVAVTQLPTYANQELSVFPNPNTGQFSVNLTSNQNEPIHISVTDITGRKVKELTSFTNKETNIQLGTPPGLYFVNVATQTGKWSTKVLVQ